MIGVWELAESIAATVGDYRAGEIKPIDASHVFDWISQFAEPSRFEMLRELDHILGRTYWSKSRVLEYFRTTIMESPLVGDNPREYWRSSTFIRRQQFGSSQRILLDLFDGVLADTCGFGVTACQGGRTYVYLDDGVFSGGHVKKDVGDWIKQEAPHSSSIVIVTLVSHSRGQWRAENQLREIADACGKRVRIRFHHSVYFKNGNSSSKNAAVLWPDSLPETGPVAEFVSTLPHDRHLLRPQGGRADPAIFSSESSRQLLEQELLSAGVAIRGKYPALKDRWRPLGNNAWGLGFGGLVVTFINCPNNCPLAFWWGDTNILPPPVWYPLFPRRPNQTGL